jgi:hypothetical protein
MTPRRTVLVAVVTAAAATATPAAAQPAAAPPQPYVLIAPPPPAPPPVRSLRDRTHNSIFPNGNLVRAGDVQFQMHELGLYNRAAFGLNDRVEVSIGAPLVPVVVSAGARVSATPRDSRLRLVLGGGVWSPINDDDQGEYVYQVSMTAGYQAERLEVHGTITRFSAALEGDQALFGASLGMSYQFGPKAAMIAEAGHLGVLGVNACSGDCQGNDPVAFDGLLVGFKLMGERFDTDLGLAFIGDRDSREAFTLPVVSMTYRY